MKKEFLARKDNNSEKWNKLLAIVEEKMQFRLLRALERILSYHFEKRVLHIELSSEDDRYLSQSSVIQHLELLVNEAFGLEEIKIK